MEGTGVRWIPKDKHKVSGNKYENKTVESIIKLINKPIHRGEFSL